jgi:hypothetical protein
MKFLSLAPDGLDDQAAITLGAAKSNPIIKQDEE